MSTITVTLADEDLAFLRRFSKEQGTSAEEMLARQARSLRRQLERPLPPATTAASGIISGDVEASNAYSDHLDRKYR
jgi:hypothetical protein